MPFPTQAAAAALDPTDPFLREAQTFPKLAEEEVARIAAYGVEEAIPAGVDLIFRVRRLRRVPARRVGLVLVCPTETGLGQPRTCDRCGICWRGGR